ncbi:MAG: hypothetical protein E7261_10975 [Lachnospiraceae bacterium]|nr:hypothetical protein [Lachnospiraceae bacterium]
MASKRVLDKGTPKERIQVNFEIKTADGRRKRSSKTFPASTPKKTINAFIRKVEEEYEASSGIVLETYKVTLREFTEIYLKDYVSRKLEPTTQNNYKQMLNEKNHGILVELGDCQLMKLDRRQVQRYVHLLQDHGLSPKSVKNYVMLLSGIYEYATKYGYIEAKRNPCSMVDLPKQNKKQISVYSPEEISVLLKLINENNDELLQFAVYCGVGLGLRRSEIAGLTLSAVNLKDHSIHISQAKVYAGRKEFLKATKTQAGDRLVFMSEEVEKIVRQRISKYKENRLKHGRVFNDSGFLFSDEFGNPMHTSIIGNRFAKFIKKNSAQLPHITFHGLRHTFASNLITQADADIVSVKELMGHSSVSTTLSVYSHSFDERKRALAEKMNGIMAIEKQAVSQ